MATQTDRGVPLSTLSPKFLHTNSTSHTWPFSAIAELIDNAYDPDVNAKQFWIDKTMVKGELCLTFTDNGNGLDHQTMHKMLSFGYSDKIAINGLEPIGIYGNGFKSGSMRLGKDAIVFSKSKSTSCVGMLSQTYLEKIDAKQIVVPIVCFEETESDKFHVREEHEASLQDILQFSPFRSKEELLAEIHAISLCWSEEKTETGTRIIIWNLRRTSTETTEFDFEKDRYDIRIPSEVYEMMNNPSQLPDRTTSYIPESVYSLQAYCSILYLKPRMQVMVRGQKVKSQLIAKSLAYIRKDHYKPNFLNKRIPITFGYNTKSKDQYGIMMYHKNRLIKAYERVGCQLKANNKGVGVIGVIECNFLDPTHNKQSFIETDKYRKTMTSLGIKLEEYWNEIRYRKTKENPNSTIPVEDTMKRPDQNWVQCDDCLQWRKLPDGIDCSKLPDKWFCRMNPDPQFRSCHVEEEPEDSDDDQPSYRKTYKLQEREDRMKAEKKQLDLKLQEQQRLAALAKQNETLRRQQESLTLQLHQTSPSTPTTVQGKSLQGVAARDKFSTQRSSTNSQAASRSSSIGGLPIITSVCSLSLNSNSGKRTQPVPPHSTAKRPRVNGFQHRTSDTPSAGNVSSPSVLAHSSNDDDDDTDDDILILETVSTPKPQKPAIDVRRVKEEKEETENPISMLLECSDDAAVDDPTEMCPAASATVETAPPPAVATTTTQTEVREVKQEEESQTQTQGKAKAALSKPGESGTEKSSDVNICNLREREFKQESSRGSQSENQGEQALQSGVTHMQNDQSVGPACAHGRDTNCSPHQYPSIMAVQEQQDQLLELMQQTAQERDSFKDQVQKLNSQLQDMQTRLQEFSQMNVKNESSHQTCQTEDSDVKDYKSLFEKAKQKINDLIKDKEVLLSAAEAGAKLSTAQDKEKELDEISLQVSCLVEKLNERNKERDELRLQLDRLEEEKSNLAAQCEELQLSLQQQKENAQSSKRTIDFSVQARPEEPGVSTDFGTHSSSDASRSLLELRQNVGRLLISYLPALDLDLQQVNFECNVIDEILEQVLSNMDSH